MNNTPAICVCGAGTMGSGIAQVFASANHRTVLFDVNAEVLDKARERIYSDLGRQAEKQKISHEQKSTALNLLHFTTEISDCRADVIIEAIYENSDAKTELINRLFEINEQRCIVATNTSSLSVDAVSQTISAPERFAGMHFFNPATIMKLVEVVTTPAVAESTVLLLCDLARSVGKTPVVCRDSPGFIVNRVARPYYIEALHLVEKYEVPFTSMDRLLESSGFRMGPFKLMDLIGNDVNFAVSNIVYDALHRPERLKPSAIQENLVKEGRLGRKSGKGYYEY